MACVSRMAGIALAAGCSPSSGAPSQGGKAGADASMLGSGGGLLFVDGSRLDDARASLAIVPASPVIVITVVNGNVTQVALEGGGSASPLSFHARTAEGSEVAVTWSFDRHELGVIAEDGGFTAKGTLGGVGHVTASSPEAEGSTTVTVKLHVTQNGAMAGSDPGSDSDLGGIGGVGGVPVGGPVDPVTEERLRTGGTPPASPEDFSWLYPYDKTVWPRGLLPPLLMWRSNSGATSVYIHLKESTYEFEGTYGGAKLTQHLIEATAWRQATLSNAGDPLRVEIKIDDGKVTYGPIAENWLIAAGQLLGTVYYNSYNSQVAGPSDVAKGAVLAIKPGQRNPVVALSSTQAECHDCHTVSADGSTMVMQGPSVWGSDVTLNRTQVFSLRDPDKPPILYTEDEALPNKLTWGALYPDGTMSLANSGDGFHAYAGRSDLFRVTDGTPAGATGWQEVVTRAGTPAFSPDGRRIAFSFLEGAGAPGVAASAGHTLAFMDFDCGAPSGSVTCSGGYAFSGLRLVYETQDPTRYLGWPSFSPDGSSILFQTTRKAPAADWGSNVYTLDKAEAELWCATAPPLGGPPAQAVPLYALDGFDQEGGSYLPVVDTTHPFQRQLGRPIDTALNYEPTVNPIASGGYYWVVFTSRRAYGNVLTGDPWADEISGKPGLFTKKLWVAAIDIHAEPGKDPSHPAFYLPGQELRAGNMRGYWVADPCHGDRAACETGSECCNGYCVESDGGALVCGSKPNVCAREFDKCGRPEDCCGFALGYVCLNTHCAAPPPAVK